MDPLEKLLAELQVEYEQPAKPQQRQPQSQVTPSFGKQLSKSDVLIDSLLADVKEDFQQQDLAQELQKQEQLRQEQIRQQELQAQQQEALKKQAKTWLEELDPFSSEGLWFERFSEKYGSKLEAAIDYLQDIEEN